MFNQMVINPAYAGSKEVIEAKMLARTQWVGVDGAPNTQTLSVHGPLKKKRVGLGGHLIADQIGPKKMVGVFGAYAYRLPILQGNLAMGLRFGVYNYSYNWGKVDYKDNNDPYAGLATTRTTTPSADFGLYYNNDIMYAGVAATHIFNGRITPLKNPNGDNAQLSPHIFATYGIGFRVNEQLVLNPSFVIKATKAAPMNVDISCNALLDDKIWVGVSVRSNFGFVVLAQYYLTDKLKMGYAYELGTNAFERNTKGTHEIMIGYDFNLYKSKILSPRYL